jgi:hypothetical protein
VHALALWPVLVAWLAAGPVDASANGGPVRAASADLRVALDDLLARSPTARALASRLYCTDVIIYVERTVSPLVPTARIQLVAAVPGARFLRIGVNAAVVNADLGPLLAHELQHAVEIAERDPIRDVRAVRDLYLRIGRDRGGDRFETDAAQEVEWIVRSELRTKIGG